MVMDLTKYKISAFMGIITMGTGSFMACLSKSQTIMHIGNFLLVVSIAIMFYAFSKWQP